MTDDAIREIHGVKCRLSGHADRERITVHECEDGIGLQSTVTSNHSALLTAWQARYLAAKLYRLARRNRQRAEPIPNPGAEA